MKTKRYLLFVGTSYYPHGGANDLVAVEDSTDEAFDTLLEHFSSKFDTWAHLYDTEMQTIVARWRRRPKLINPPIDELPWTVIP